MKVKTKSYMHMQASIMAMMTSMNKSGGILGVRIDEIYGKASRKLRKLEGGGRIPGHRSYIPHQGEKECERRRMQRSRLCRRQALSMGWTA